MSIINNGPITTHTWFDNMFGECIEVHNSNLVSVKNPEGIALKWSEREGKTICRMSLTNNQQWNKEKVLQVIEDYISNEL